MALPKVAIVGRPNVGKSSLFNWLAGRMISIVDPTAGVTRDRVTHLLRANDPNSTAGERYFELIDTGGMGIEDPDQLTEDIERQIELAIDEADVIAFVVDGRLGVNPLDEHVAERLRAVEKTKLLIVNKCDSTKVDDEVHVFHRLTDAPLVITSVKGNRNRAQLFDALLAALPPADEFEQAEGEEQSAEPELKLAIVGRRNVGKSTFINQLAQDERVIVSEVPGTTRDSVDIRFEVDGKVIIAIDTPGVRRKKSLANDIEFYGLVRAQRSIRRADVVLMFFDAKETISKVDKQLMEEVLARETPCIFVVNKWDLGRDEGMTSDKWGDYLVRTFGDLRYVPVAFLTAKDGKNVKKVVNLAQQLFKQARERVSTGKLNKLVQLAWENNPPHYRKNRRPKIFYAAQVAVQPPTIVLKCNDPSLFSETWKRYLLGVFRDELPFSEIPIRLHLRRRGKDEEAID